MSIIIGLMIVLAPSQQLSLSSDRQMGQSQAQAQGEIKDEPVTSATVKAHIEGTPKEGGKSVQTQVKIDR